MKEIARLFAATWQAARARQEEARREDALEEARCAFAATWLQYEAGKASEAAISSAADRVQQLEELLGV